MREKRRQPTRADVSREAGVSQTTVSYALSGSKYADEIGPETRKRVLDAAKRLGYVRDSVATALRRGYSDNIVVLAVTWHLVDAHAVTTMALGEAAAEKGLTALLQIASDDDTGTNLLRRIRSLYPFGIVLIWDSPGVPAQMLLNLQAEGVPIIDLMPSSPPGIPTITADRENGFYLCTKHLIELGHRRIGLVRETFSASRTSSQKTAGYARALEEAGIDFESGLVQDVNAYHYEGGLEGFPKLIARYPEITAVVCTSDATALGVIASAQEKGLTVPSDLSVTGYGAQSEGAYLRPRLTTVAPRYVDLAEDTMSALIKMRKGARGAPTKPVYKPVDLIVRESTARPRACLLRL